ncbi:MAG: oxidoreductase [Bacteriovoracia bacterium]
MNKKFGKFSTALEVVDGIELHGKTAIVTGASSGIGVETARALAAAGANTILAVRNTTKGQQTAEEIKKSLPNRKVNLEVMKLDLSSFQSVREFCDDFSKHHQKLDILVNNAGIMACPLTRTPQGYESQFATCHLGHFLLTTLLLPQLKASGKARVVCLSSTGHRLSPVIFDDIHFEKTPYDKWKAYGQAKSANALFAFELNRRYKDAGLRAFSVHPGGIMTGLQKDLSIEEMRAMGWLKPDDTPVDGFKNLQQGASTSVWAATAPELEPFGGQYLEDCHIAEPNDGKNPAVGVHLHVYDPVSAERLWVESEKMVAVV